MQSYMNSLNETVSMETEASAPCPDIARSPGEVGGGGGGSQAYHNSFMNCEEKPLKMEASSNHNTGPASCFSAASSQDFPAPPHPVGVLPPSPSQFQQGVPSGYHIPAHCPANVNKKPAAAAAGTDNAKYTYMLAANQSQCPVTGATSSSQPTPANQNVFSSAAGENQKQTSCPWKLNGGAKVLVRNSPVNLRSNAVVEMKLSDLFLLCFTRVVTLR